MLFRKPIPSLRTRVLSSSVTSSSAKRRETAAVSSSSYSNTHDTIATASTTAIGSPTSLDSNTSQSNTVITTTTATTATGTSSEGRRREGGGGAAKRSHIRWQRRVRENRRGRNKSTVVNDFDALQAVECGDGLLSCGVAETSSSSSSLSSVPPQAPSSSNANNGNNNSLINSKRPGWELTVGDAVISENPNALLHFSNDLLWVPFLTRLHERGAFGRARDKWSLLRFLPPSPELLSALPFLTNTAGANTLTSSLVPSTRKTVDQQQETLAGAGGGHNGREGESAAAEDDSQYTENNSKLNPFPNLDHTSAVAYFSPESETSLTTHSSEGIDETTTSKHNKRGAAAAADRNTSTKASDISTSSSSSFLTQTTPSAQQQQLEPRAYHVNELRLAPPRLWLAISHRLITQWQQQQQQQQRAATATEGPLKRLGLWHDILFALASNPVFYEEDGGDDYQQQGGGNDAHHHHPAETLNNTLMHSRGSSSSGGGEAPSFLHSLERWLGPRRQTNEESSESYSVTPLRAAPEFHTQLVSVVRLFYEDMKGIQRQVRPPRPDPVSSHQHLPHYSFRNTSNNNNNSSNTYARSSNDDSDDLNAKRVVHCTRFPPILARRFRKLYRQKHYHQKNSSHGGKGTLLLYADLIRECHFGEERLAHVIETETERWFLLDNQSDRNTSDSNKQNKTDGFQSHRRPPDGSSAVVCLTSFMQDTEIYEHLITVPTRRESGIPPHLQWPASLDFAHFALGHLCALWRVRGGMEVAGTDPRYVDSIQTSNSHLSGSDGSRVADAYHLPIVNNSFDKRVGPGGGGGGRNGKAANNHSTGASHHREKGTQSSGPSEEVSRALARALWNVMEAAVYAPEVTPPDGQTTPPAFSTQAPVPAARSTVITITTTTLKSVEDMTYYYYVNYLLEQHQRNTGANHTPPALIPGREGVRVMSAVVKVAEALYEQLPCLATSRPSLSSPSSSSVRSALYDTSVLLPSYLYAAEADGADAAAMAAASAPGKEGGSDTISDGALQSTQNEKDATAAGGVSHTTAATPDAANINSNKQQQRYHPSPSPSSSSCSPPPAEGEAARAERLRLRRWRQLQEAELQSRVHRLQERNQRVTWCVLRGARAAAVGAMEEKATRQRFSCAEGYMQVLLVAATVECLNPHLDALPADTKSWRSQQSHRPQQQHENHQQRTISEEEEEVGYYSEDLRRWAWRVMSEVSRRNRMTANAPSSSAVLDSPESGGNSRSTSEDDDVDDSALASGLPRRVLSLESVQRLFHPFYYHTSPAVGMSGLTAATDATNVTSSSLGVDNRNGSGDDGGAATQPLFPFPRNTDNHAHDDHYHRLSCRRPHRVIHSEDNVSRAWEAQRDTLPALAASQFALLSLGYRALRHHLLAALPALVQLQQQQALQQQGEGASSRNGGSVVGSHHTDGSVDDDESYEATRDIDDESNDFSRDSPDGSGGSLPLPNSSSSSALVSQRVTTAAAAQAQRWRALLRSVQQGLRLLRGPWAAAAGRPLGLTRGEAEGGWLRMLAMDDDVFNTVATLSQQVRGATHNNNNKRINGERDEEGSIGVDEFWADTLALAWTELFLQDDEAMDRRGHHSAQSGSRYDDCRATLLHTRWPNKKGRRSSLPLTTHSGASGSARGGDVLVAVLGATNDGALACAEAWPEEGDHHTSGFVHTDHHSLYAKGSGSSSNINNDTSVSTTSSPCWQCGCGWGDNPGHTLSCLRCSVSLSAEGGGGGAPFAFACAQCGWRNHTREPLPACLCCGAAHPRLEAALNDGEEEEVVRHGGNSSTTLSSTPDVANYVLTGDGDLYCLDTSRVIVPKEAVPRSCAVYHCLDCDHHSLVPLAALRGDHRDPQRSVRCFYCGISGGVSEAEVASVTARLSSVAATESSDTYADVGNASNNEKDTALINGGGVQHGCLSPYMEWRCGCGAGSSGDSNASGNGISPAHTHCAACSSASQLAYTCPACLSLVSGAAGALTEGCGHCGTPHPAVTATDTQRADSLVLTDGSFINEAASGAAEEPDSLGLHPLNRDNMSDENLSLPEFPPGLRVSSLTAVPGATDLLVGYSTDAAVAGGTNAGSESSAAHHLPHRVRHHPNNNDFNNSIDNNNSQESITTAAAGGGGGTSLLRTRTSGRPWPCHHCGTFNSDVDTESRLASNDHSGNTAQHRRRRSRCRRCHTPRIPPHTWRVDERWGCRHCGLGCAADGEGAKNQTNNDMIVTVASAGAPASAAAAVPATAPNATGISTHTTATTNSTSSISAGGNYGYRCRRCLQPSPAVPKEEIFLWRCPLCRQANPSWRARCEIVGCGGRQSDCNGLAAHLRGRQEEVEEEGLRAGSDTAGTLAPPLPPPPPPPPDLRPASYRAPYIVTAACPGCGNACVGASTVCGCEHCGYRLPSLLSSSSSHSSVAASATAATVEENIIRPLRNHSQESSTTTTTTATTTTDSDNATADTDAREEKTKAQEEEARLAALSALLLSAADAVEAASAPPSDKTATYMSSDTQKNKSNNNNNSSGGNNGGGGGGGGSGGGGASSSGSGDNDRGGCTAASVSAPSPQRTWDSLHCGDGSCVSDNDRRKASAAAAGTAGGNLRGGGGPSPRRGPCAIIDAPLVHHIRLTPPCLSLAASGISNSNNNNSSGSIGASGGLSADVGTRRWGELDTRLELGGCAAEGDWRGAYEAAVGPYGL